MTRHLTETEIGNANLMLLASILADADARHRAAREPAYDQTRWAHPCGTPACAIGHWRASKGRSASGPSGQSDIPEYQAEFALDDEQWADLFGYRPGYARTAAEAAAKIRALVATRSAERSAS